MNERFLVLVGHSRTMCKFSARMPFSTQGTVSLHKKNKRKKLSFGVVF